MFAGADWQRSYCFAQHKSTCSSEPKLPGMSHKAPDLQLSLNDERAPARGGYYEDGTHYTVAYSAKAIASEEYQPNVRRNAAEDPDLVE